MGRKTFVDCAPTCGDGYYCDYCTRRIRVEAWKNATPASRSYDRQMEPGMAHALDQIPQGCSCHISAPCGYCTSLTEEEAAEAWA